MYKKLTSVFLSSIIFFTSNTPLVLAQNVSGEATAPSAGQGSSGITAEDQKMMIAPDSKLLPRPDGGGVMPFSGQNHNYSVVFRGNGESIVTLRVSLTNTSESETLKDVTLRIPKVTEPKDLSAYQILVTPPCVRYDDRPLVQTFPYVPPKCIEYGEPDYRYYYGGGKYQKAKTDFSGDTLKVTLPTALAPQKTGSFFLYYRGFGYAKKDMFGAYKFDFETIKSTDQINQLTLGISTDADQFLKGAKGEVQYRTSEATMALKAAPAADAGAVANSTVDSFVSQIGQGTIVKTASNLAALESYKVNGIYANSRTKLYGKELTTVLGVIIFFILLVLLVLHALQKRMFKKDKVDSQSNKVMTDEGMKRVAFGAGVSFASALVTAGYSIAVYAITNALANLVDYQYQAVVMILIIVISFAIYLLVIIGPAFFVGYKKGIGWGIGTFVMTIVWLILMAVVTVAVLFMFRSQNNYPPVPLIKGGVSLPQAVD